MVQYVLMNPSFNLKILDISSTLYNLYKSGATHLASVMVCTRGSILFLWFWLDHLNALFSIEVP
jgi:hypothetical protein